MAITTIWGSATAAPVTTPNATSQANGFNCGPADPGLFNWLFREITTAVINLTTRMAAAETGVTKATGANSTFTAGTIK